MSSEPYAVKEHTMSTSHIRGYARGIGNERTDRLQLAIRQYNPSLDLSHQLGDFISITLPGSGVAKGCCEPFFSDPILHTSALRIRSIWSLDAICTRPSYQLKQDVVGDESKSIDGCRDAWHVINHL
ncbi:hypothetical protein LTS18_010153 [Coniosporium uncinatum]|uniref:Uncharacterized protein n=1 Tax=Coniosporium uncinatum TaxID=93489 RepID=A0ACC3D082_9PEZI|nr:hypothetical protein LTS18_010153 [Coniosporium uncinatum]